MLVHKQRIDEYLADIDHMLAQQDALHQDYNIRIHWQHPDFRPPPSHLHIEDSAVRAKIQLLNRALCRHNAYVHKLEPRDDTPSWYLTITQEPNPTYIIHRGFIINGSDLLDFIDKLITDCLTHPIGEIDMNIYKTDTFKYLEGIMVKDRPMTLTIKGAAVEEISNGNNTEQKILLHFQETTKAAIMNKTNLKAIASQLGPETDNWIGRKVTVYAEKGRWFGKESWALRFSVAREQPAPEQSPPLAEEQPPTPEKPTNGPNGQEATTELNPDQLEQFKLAVARLIEENPHLTIDQAQTQVAAALDLKSNPGDNTLDQANTDFF